MEPRFVYTMIREVIRFCRRFNCGALVYREPTDWLRQHGWFAKHGAPMSWTKLAACLQFKLERVGITLETVPCGKHDLDGHYGAA